MITYNQTGWLRKKHSLHTILSMLAMRSWNQRVYPLADEISLFFLQFIDPVRGNQMFISTHHVFFWFVMRLWCTIFQILARKAMSSQHVNRDGNLSLKERVGWGGGGGGGQYIFLIKNFFSHWFNTESHGLFNIIFPLCKRPITFTVQVLVIALSFLSKTKWSIPESN